MGQPTPWVNPAHGSTNPMNNCVADGPRDALSVETLPAAARNELYNRAATNQSNGVRGLQLAEPTCSKQPRLVDCRIGVVNKFDRRRVLLATRRTFRVEILKPIVWDKCHRKHPCFIIAQCGIGGRKASCQKSARFVHLFLCIAGL